MHYTTKDPAVIRSEDEAWSILEAALRGDATFEDFGSLKLEGWPEIKAYIPDERLHGALTPYMMEGFIHLQRSVFRSYALLVKQEANARLLTDAEKHKLELVVDVEEGSSDNKVEFWDIITEVAKAMVDKMEPTHIVVTIIGLGLLYAGQSVYRARLDKDKEIKIAEIQNESVKQALQAVQFSQQQDVERMKLFAKLNDVQPKLMQVAQDSEEAQQSLVRHFTKDTNAKINDVDISQDVGQRLTRGTRTESHDIRLDSIYKINKVDTTSVDGFRVRLSDTNSDKEFDAGVQDALLSEEHKEILRTAEWEKSPVHLKINAKERSGAIVEAVIIDVEHYDPDE